MVGEMVLAGETSRASRGHISQPIPHQLQGGHLRLLPVLPDRKIIFHPNTV